MRRRKFYPRKKVLKRKVSFKNHRHIVKPMKGLTSIPVRFRSRRLP